ncbi:MAG: nucleotidyl transferase AbiEii/AbiGii toxin family protein [Proteiniphilum sp.]
MNKWLAVADETKRNAYIQIAEKLGMSAFAVEKDWWVVQTLSVIFEMEVGQHLIFKGGTSLSKAWKLIERFSEDIDLAIDRDFFGYNGELTKKERARLRKASGIYVDTVFFNELKSGFEANGFSNLKMELVQEIESDKDRTINIFYPNVIPTPGYVQPKIQLEIGCRSLREPFTMQPIASLVDESYPDSEFARKAVNVPTVNPERTFLEKIFLLHEEFQRPAEKMRVDRLSRHLYDVYKLSGNVFAVKALYNKELYQTIVDHRYKFNRIGHINYNLHQPQTIDMLPPTQLMDAWKADYATMVEQMIYETNPPTFNELISELTRLKEKINSMEWKFEIEFPNPITPD